VTSSLALQARLLALVLLIRQERDAAALLGHLRAAEQLLRSLADEEHEIFEEGVDALLHELDLAVNSVRRRAPLTLARAAEAALSQSQRCGEVYLRALLAHVEEHSR
jgi:hypothetical protein